MLGMVQNLKDLTITDDPPLPDREHCANRKVRQCCLREKKLNTKPLRLIWRETVIKGDKKPNREILRANAENAAILAFGDCAFPSTCFGRKKCDLNNDLWHNRSTHMECLT